jgi:hypothetical protein
VLNFLGAADDVVAGADGMKVAAAGSSTIAGRQCDGFTVVDRIGDNKWEAWLQKKDVHYLS